MHSANCEALVAIMFITLIANIFSSIENMRLCFSAKAGIVLKFWAKLASCSYKFVLIKSAIPVIQVFTASLMFLANTRLYLQTLILLNDFKFSWSSIPWIDGMEVGIEQYRGGGYRTIVRGIEQLWGGTEHFHNSMFIEKSDKK